MGLNARCITTSLVQRLAWWSYNMREIKKYCTHQIPSDQTQSIFGCNSTSSIRVKLSGSVSQSSFRKKARSILTTFKAGEVFFGWKWPNQGNQSPSVNFFPWRQLSRYNTLLLHFWSLGADPYNGRWRLGRSIVAFFAWGGIGAAHLRPFGPWQRHVTSDWPGLTSNHWVGMAMTNNTIGAKSRIMATLESMNYGSFLGE